MPRLPRVQPGGYAYHVINRGNGGMALFEKPADYEAFERVLAEAAWHTRMRLLAYCLMPNHWHLVLWPRATGDLSRYMHRVTTTHVRRWHEHRHSTGLGHLYQGTYKSFLIQKNRHLLAVCRYVERNALRAKLVDRAETWRPCSLWHRDHPSKAATEAVPQLSPWPVDQPRYWRRLVNQPQNDKELKAIRQCIRRGRPLGNDSWQQRTAKRLNMQSTLRPRGRPRLDAPN